MCSHKSTHQFSTESLTNNKYLINEHEFVLNIISKRREEVEVLFGGFNMKYSSKEVCFFLSCVLHRKSSIDTGNLTKNISRTKNLSRQKPKTKSKENNRNKASALNLVCCKFLPDVTISYLDHCFASKFIPLSPLLNFCRISTEDGEPSYRVSQKALIFPCCPSSIPLHCSSWNQ